MCHRLRRHPLRGHPSKKVITFGVIATPLRHHTKCVKETFFPFFVSNVIFVFIFAAILENKKKHILSETLQLFLKFGIKSLTMDDIAKKLCISKKTLYAHVKDKEDLLENAVILFSKTEQHQIEEICGRGLNAIDESLEIKRWVLDMLQNIHPSVAYDMEKFHPRVHQKMLASRQAIIYKCVFENIVKGKKDGLYRKEINPDVLAKLYVGRMEAMFDQDLFPSKEYNVSDIYMEWFSYHIHGMATAKGIELLNKNILNSSPSTKKKSTKKQ
jgi:AcrR family transcriptional regulator